jgi:hypothetical protein
MWISNSLPYQQCNSDTITITTAGNATITTTTTTTSSTTNSLLIFKNRASYI